MKKENEIKVFEDKKVRTLWNTEHEKWYLSIVDVVAVLTDSPNQRKYWSVLKTRLKAEGSQLATNCSQLDIQLSPHAGMNRARFPGSWRKTGYY